MGKTFKQNSSHKPRSHGRTFTKKNKKKDWKLPHQNMDDPNLDNLDRKFDEQ